VRCYKLWFVMLHTGFWFFGVILLWPIGCVVACEILAQSYLFIADSFFVASMFLKCRNAFCTLLTFRGDEMLWRCSSGTKGLLHGFGYAARTKWPRFPLFSKIRWLGRLGIVGTDSKWTLNIVLHDMEETLKYIAQFSKYLSGQSNIFIFPLSKK
jgi:hypothetical protein